MSIHPATATHNINPSSAAAAAGHQVLVLDANPYYGGAWSNLTLQQLYDVLCNAARASQHPPECQAPPTCTQVDVSGPLDADLQAIASSFTLDLAPKALFCQGPFMQLLLAAGVHHYLEFKLLAARYLVEFPHIACCTHRKNTNKLEHALELFLYQVHMACICVHVYAAACQLMPVDASCCHLMPAS